MRAVLIAATLAVGLNSALIPIAAAQNAAATYPSRPVRWIVPFAPGASNDITARLLAQKMSDSMGQQFVVDNRPGSGGSLGAKIVVDAAPDGYTVLHANPGPSINNVLLRTKPPYQMSDLAPVMFIGYSPLIIVAAPGFAPNNARELLAYAKANPGKLTWASSGNGSSLHIAQALFAAATGAEFVHVPYKGTAPAFLDVLSRRVDVVYTTVVSGDAHIKAGRLKILAVAAPKRQSVIPNVPTLLEEGIRNAEATVWFGMQVPAKTPRSIIAKLNAELNKAMIQPDVKAKLDQLGLVSAGGSVEEFSKFMQGEADRLRMLIKTKRVEMMD
ncbi:MAG: tripartite tricarboxylate transporter substrate binding protein [Betaproteobacteria bacterium]|nr:tripartite tricarboxylate transporter substrate binding protein [Betaproteobacteria bacterium]MDH4293324.1 tripartite tricarboxylate transporter substrate binding protein [Betaproteobacteria bacterium]MDH5343013.1 tripartite tricarboxylate transporter substrate binding protein [Betaproteobacteria bacterium]